MTHDEKIVEAVARAISGAPFPSKQSLAKARAAITAYQAEASKKRIGGAHKIAMAIRDVEEGHLAAVHFNGQTWRPEPQWQDISTAPTLERVFVAGWQPRSGNVQGYWWLYEDTTDENGCPMDHPTATKWRPLPPAPKATP